MTGPAVVISLFEPDPGREAEVALWHARLERVAAAQVGFVGCRLATASMPEGRWGVAVSFTHETDLRRWLTSDERASAVAEATATGLLRRPGVEVVLQDDEHPPPGCAVFVHRVAPEDEDAFRRAEQAVERAAAATPGFVGSALFGPGVVPGAWLALTRFTDQERLDAWLASDRRRTAAQPLEELLAGPIAAFTTRTPFGGVIRVESGRAEVTPHWKTAMTILLVLYPAIMLMSRFLTPRLAERDVPPWLAVFLVNALGVGALTWVLMPVASRALHRWLDPVTGRSRRVTAIGAVAVVAGYVAWMLLFANVGFLELGG